MTKNVYRYKLQIERLKEKEDERKNIIPSICGCTEMKLLRTNDQACWIHCLDCGSESEAFAKRKDAIKFWNQTCQRFDAEIIYDQEKER